MTRERLLIQGAGEWLAAARSEREDRRLRVAFEAARHAAELACKAILVARTGEHPKSHLVVGLLAREGWLPPGTDGRALHRLLADFTLGTYGFERTLTAADVDAALALAATVVSGAEKMLAKE